MSVLLFFVQIYQKSFQCQINFLKSHICYEKKKFGCFTERNIRYEYKDNIRNVADCVVRNTVNKGNQEISSMV